ncbi:hypothetical protein ER308_16770 [Egibacter rhizosphaerae]|uniref:Acetyl xylan esterase domain-containing protein n=1 Tax=Egibacter rhizosphaerae TaxID=1670831 RepID=A0A411YIK7_9ACTN|nr:prolyl oligopeptidase family serine peptidase [Egibacter rhizosphaerae]QBI21063.1 hypothetical protein ER308_16770 [Egibacter rhizosphaerae]
MSASEQRLDSPAEIRDFLGVDTPSSPPAYETEWVEPQSDYTLARIVYEVSDGDRVPAYLLRPGAGVGEPEATASPGIVVFHQHASQWHLGKSEVAGLAGEPLQALGPPLARAGITVLAPDSVCFEDRRRQTDGLERHHDDLHQHDNELAYRLVAGDTLARKVLQDAVEAVSVLSAVPGVDPTRLGAVGHSYGGHNTLLLSAIDERIRFACASGAAATYRAKIAAEVSLERALVVPGIAHRLDMDTVVACIAPRPALLVAGTDDRHAIDASEVAASAAAAYAATGAADALECRVMDGGHELTGERHELIVGWARARAMSGE